MLALYFECAILELVECWPTDVQDVWWGEIFTADATLTWWGPDAIKDMCRDILEGLDLEENFRYCLWHSIPWDDIFERLRARFKEVRGISADACDPEVSSQD